MANETVSYLDGRLFNWLNEHYDGKRSKCGNKFILNDKATRVKIGHNKSSTQYFHTACREKMYY